MKRVAVVGGGFSGLACIYHLLHLPFGGEVTLFDGKGIGGGSSGIASGLLHPYVGESGVCSWQGAQGMKETKKLLERVGQEVYAAGGILRIAVTLRQEEVFRKLASCYSDIDWWEAAKCRTSLLGGCDRPGIFIRSGITVHAPLYLQRLWALCEGLGAQFEKKNVALDDLKGFDVVVLAAGAGIRSFTCMEKLDLRFNKGQVLICQKPDSFPVEKSVIGKGYLACSDREELCYLGATYERDYLTELPCLGTATDIIFQKVRQFLPCYNSFSVKKCLAGLRVVSGAHHPRPLVRKLCDKLYVITGMGSRGLLYHALLGKRIAQEIAA